MGRNEGGTCQVTVEDRPEYDKGSDLQLDETQSLDCPPLIESCASLPRHRWLWKNLDKSGTALFIRFNSIVISSDPRSKIFEVERES